MIIDVSFELAAFTCVLHLYDPIGSFLVVLEIS